MPKFSESSEKRLATCHPKLRELFQEVVKGYDCTVLCGFRGQDEQDSAFEKGTSKVKWPESKHNNFPSLAVDVAPYPIDWKDTNRFYHFAGYVRAVAERLGIKVRQGVDWNGNLDFKDESFFDGPHVEIVLDAPNVFKAE